MKISFVGSGNVAYTLAHALYSKGEEILTIVSKSKQNAEYLAHALGAKGTDNINEIDPYSDIVFLCVPDDIIPDISKSISNSNIIQVHTSGTVPMLALDTENRGVYYPLQSLTKGVEIDFDQVPFLLEANNTQVEIAIDKLACNLSNIVRFKNSSERRNLHVAAVFSNNFTNHLLDISQKLCKENKLDFEFLKPLVIQTVAKAFSIGAKEAQTGPAIRNDMKTIGLHRELLKDKPNYLKVYDAITDSIIG